MEGQCVGCGRNANGRRGGWRSKGKPARIKKWRVNLGESEIREETEGILLRPGVKKMRHVYISGCTLCGYLIPFLK